MTNETDPQEKFDVVEYADRVTLTVIPVESQLDLDGTTELFVTSLGSVRLDSVWLERQVQDFVREIPAEDHGCSGYHVPYSLKITRGNTDWGASGAVLDAVLFIGAAGGVAAVTGIVGNAAYDLLKSFAVRIGERIYGGAVVEVLSEDEASRLAEHFIYNRYSVSPHLLKARRVSSDLGGGTVEIEYVDDRGTAYSCTVFSSPKGGAAVTKVTRSNEDGTPIQIRRLTDS